MGACICCGSNEYESTKNQDTDPEDEQYFEDIDLKQEEKKEIIIEKPNQDQLDKLPKDLQDLFHHEAKYEIDDNGSVTFWPTPNCEVATKKLESQKMTVECIPRNQQCTKAAIFSDPDIEIVTECNWKYGVSSFIISSLTAWSKHYPFRFRPEHIWLLILQATAVHVDQNAEKLRSKYVKHKGKMQLNVDVSANPSYEEWIDVVKNFASQIDKNTVKGTGKLFECDFSSSTLTEKIAAKISIMDICKNYFSYGVSTACGFPRIKLDGTK